MKCSKKKKFETEDEALAFLKDHRMKNMGVYECKCRFFHTYSKFHGKGHK